MRKILSFLLAICVFSTFAFLAVGSSDNDSMAESTTSENEASQPTTEMATDEITSENPINTTGNVRPEYKEAVDNYEAFMDEYIDVLQRYSNSSGNDSALIAEHAEISAQQKIEYDKISQWSSDDLNNAEEQYWFDAQERINKKLDAIE